MRFLSETLRLLRDRIVLAVSLAIMGITLVGWIVVGAGLVTLWGCNSSFVGMSKRTMRGTLEPVTLIGTTGLSAGQLATMRDFVSRMESATYDVDLSRLEIGDLTIEVDGARRWLVARFRFRGVEYVFEGVLLSRDLLVHDSSSIQFQPRIVEAEGLSGGTFLDIEAARRPWNALKAALILIAREAEKSIRL